MSFDDNDDQTGSWTIFGGKCPHGSQCTKRHHIIKQCSIYEEASETVINHLETSPYHGLSRAEAEAAVGEQDIESWEVDKKEWYDWQNKFQNKRKMKAEWKEAAASSITRSVAARSSGSAGSSGYGTAMIELPEMQLRACVDSLKRAKVSSESAAHLCSKAARAFNEEVHVIQQCIDVVESYVPNNVVSMDDRMD